MTFWKILCIILIACAVTALVVRKTCASKPVPPATPHISVAPKPTLGKKLPLGKYTAHTTVDYVIHVHVTVDNIKSTGENVEFSLTINAADHNLHCDKITATYGRLNPSTKSIKIDTTNPCYEQTFGKVVKTLTVTYDQENDYIILSDVHLKLFNIHVPQLRLTHT